MDNNTLYNRAWLTNLYDPGALPLYSAQAATSTPSMTTDITTIAKMIPNVLLKLQQKVVQGGFIDLSEFLQANFQFKYASVEAKNAFKLVQKQVTVLMQPRKKGKHIDSRVLGYLPGPSMNRSCFMSTPRNTLS